MSTTMIDRLSGSAVIAGAGTDLEALEALSDTGLVARTGSQTFAGRTLTAPAAGLAITNPAGIAGNPTFALADDLAALEALSSTGFAARTGAGTWAQRTITSANAALTVTNPGGVAADPILTVVSATQAEQEAASSTVAPVTPGRQQFHPSAAKFWAYVTVSTGTPTLYAGSYNITSITDTGTGLLTITIGTDFSSANWNCQVSVERAATALTVANLRNAGVRFGGLAAGTVLVECWDDTAVTANQVDPASWAVTGLGDQ